DGPRHRQRPQRPPPRRGGLQGARARASRRLRARPTPDRRRVDEGIVGMSGAMRGATPVDVAVVDYGAGNLVSIEQALLAAGARARRALTPDDLDGADLLVVPGVGAAAAAVGPPPAARRRGPRHRR